MLAVPASASPPPVVALALLVAGLLTELSLLAHIAAPAALLLAEPGTVLLALTVFLAALLALSVLSLATSTLLALVLLASLLALLAPVLLVTLALLAVLSSALLALSVLSPLLLTVLSLLAVSLTLLVALCLLAVLVLATALSPLALLVTLLAELAGLALSELLALVTLSTALVLTGLALFGPVLLATPLPVTAGSLPTALVVGTDPLVPLGSALLAELVALLAVLLAYLLPVFPAALALSVSTLSSLLVRSCVSAHGNNSGRILHPPSLAVVVAQSRHRPSVLLLSGP